MNKFAAALVGASILTVPAVAQTTPAAVPTAAPAPMPEAGGVVLPMDTVINVTPVEAITSKNMKEGDERRLQVATDVVEKGVVVIPRGSQITSVVTWRTGKGIGGKSAKFILTFKSVTVHGKEYALKGTHRQEGRGNTVGALLGSMIITGRSAIMEAGQLASAFTAEPIPAS